MKYLKPRRISEEVKYIQDTYNDKGNKIMHSPVVLFVYNRPEKTRETLKSLKANLLAEETILYIFSDAPKTQQDLNNVEEVRQILKSVSGFKKVILELQSENLGLANSVIKGVSKILNRHGKVIVIEDDLITHPYFLTFMNKSLEFFEQNDKVWSISGYSPDIKFPSKYLNDIYYTLRGSSWGWATWKNRWDLMKWNWTKEDFEAIFKSKKEIDVIGEDIYYLTRDLQNSLIDSWAIRWTNTQFKLGKYSVFPKNSLVSNNGFGKDSTHGNITSNFNTVLLEENIELKLENISYSGEIEKEYAKLYQLSLYNKIGILLKKIKLYRSVKKILKKIR